jgi:signal transduction histidine kinase
MTNDTASPSVTDRTDDVLRDAVHAAVARIAADLPQLAATHPVFSHYTTTTVSLVVGVLPLVADAYFASLAGDGAVTEEVAGVLREFGAGRARTGNSITQFVRFSTESPTAIIDLLIDELGDSVDDTSKLRLLRGARPVIDTILAELITGYIAERAHLAAEHEPLTAHVLAAVQAGMAFGDLDDRVIYVNDALAHFAGRHDTEVVGTAFADAFAIDGLEPLLAESGDDPDWRDLPVTDEFGVRRTLRTLVRRIDGRLHLVAIDVSDVVAAEQLRREVLRGIMHDIRSPLTLISGWASTLRDDTGRLDDGTRRDALDTIRQAAVQVQELMERLLEVELLQAAEVPVDLRAFDAAAALVALRDVLQGAGAEATDVIVEHVGDADALAFADPQLVERIVTNLVDNARRYGEGTVRIRLDGDAVELRIDVVDDGAVDADIVARAFGGRVASTKGLGIGLRAANLMATLCGGSLALVAASPTTFRLALPRPPYTSP